MEYVLGQLAFKFGSPKGELFPTFSRWAISWHDHFIPHPRNNFHPHVLGHRVLGLFSLLLITVKVAAICLPLLTLSEAYPADASAITNDTIFNLTNKSRSQNGITSLTYNSSLARAAQAKADDMLAKQYFAHVSPEGRNPWSFIKNVGYSYVAAGENLAVDFVEAESVDRAWMNSPGHRANILNSNFQEIGVGISRGTFEGHETTFVVQMFGTPPPSQVKPLPEPTVVAAPAVPAPAPVAQAPSSPAPTLAPAAPTPQTQPVASASPVASVPVVIPNQSSEMSLANAQIMPAEGGIKITVAPGQQTVKVIAVSGLKSFMLDPKEYGVWEAVIPQNTEDSSGPVTLMAFDIEGKLIETRIAEIASDLVSSYGSGEVEGVSIKVFGKEVNTDKFQHNFYLISITALLTFMLISIAVRYHVQHISMIANGSFVAMLACLLWMAG